MIGEWLDSNDFTETVTNVNYSIHTFCNIIIVMKYRHESSDSSDKRQNVTRKIN